MRYLKILLVLLSTGVLMMTFTAEVLMQPPALFMPPVTSEPPEPSGSEPPELPMLTMERVEELALKGEELSWEDFSEYSHYETGSGLYIWQFPIDHAYMLSVGGKSLKEKPMYIVLIRSATPAGQIDIRRESITDFLAEEESSRHIQ